MALSRRKFLGATLSGALGGALGGALAAVDVAPAALANGESAALPHRALGRTRQSVSILGLGMAPLGSSRTSFEEANTLVRHAVDSGITYLDVSPDYGDAEDKLRRPLTAIRSQIFLVTKVNPGEGDAAGVQRQIERSLRRMGVETIDAVHIHNLGDWDMNTVLTDAGALGGLKEARRRGFVRFIGTSGHMRPARFVQAIDTGAIDLTMNALNFADRNHYAFEDLVIPTARKHGTAVVAMKVLGGARDWRYDGHTPATLAAYHGKAIRYSLGLPGVAVAVVGMSTPAEIDSAISAVRAYHPLSVAERETLLADGRRLAETRGLYYGPVEG